jgi:raffinose/stachyose/melibiose transport system permease protein
VTTAVAPRSRLRRGSVAPIGSGLGIALSLAPAIGLFLLVYVVPGVLLVATSFADWDFISFAWSGLDNFQRLAADSAFWHAAVNTLVYCGGTLLIQVPLSILAGILLSWHLPGWRAFRAVLFLPIVISGAAFALIYSLFYNPTIGPLNRLLGAVGLDPTHDWLFDVDTAIFAVMGVYVFIVGFGMVLVMAEIVAIPRDLYEAAEVDGATRLQRERYITMPAIRQVVGTTALLGILASIKFFDVVYIMTSGGPGDRTATLGTYGYGQYVNDQWGYANAVGTVTLVIGAIAVILVRRAFRVGELAE